MLVIAHRGNNKEKLENSFSAFDASVKCGAKRIELDVQLTRDGYPVINHDDHLLHTTGLNLFCSDLDKSEMKKIKLKNGEPVPFLEDVVEKYLPNIELNIEIKGSEVDSSKATLKLIKNHPLRDRIVVSSFFPNPLIYFRDGGPDIKRACLIGDDELHWPYLGHRAPVIFMNDVNAQIIHPRFDMITENFMDQAKARDWKVYTWAPMIGEDHIKENVWTMLQSFDVDGHCTNYPTELVHWIKENADYEERIQKLGTKS
ncbi:MAG: glycerophosphodiester phosphodiesterase [Proteobacteria bacterium]|nr:glycerophosphodiester phosphodiesterase [Pseudomonadota bacterium]